MPDLCLRAMVWMMRELQVRAFNTEAPLEAGLSKCAREGASAEQSRTVDLNRTSDTHHLLKAFSSSEIQPEGLSRIQLQAHIGFLRTEEVDELFPKLCLRLWNTVAVTRIRTCSRIQTT